MALDLAAAASACLMAWTSGDPDAARPLLAEDVVFEDPLGHTQGADEYVSGARRLAGSVRGADVKQAMVDGDNVCLVYELHSAAGPMSSVGWYHFCDDRIDAVRAYFDPRPLIDGRVTPAVAPTGADARPGFPLFAASLQLWEAD